MGITIFYGMWKCVPAPFLLIIQAAVQK